MAVAFYGAAWLAGALAALGSAVYAQPITVEAEEFVLTRYAVESHDAASGGALISTRTTEATPHEARYTAPSAGRYALTLFAFDEDDGAGKIELFNNEALLATFRLDQAPAGGGWLRRSVSVPDVALEERRGVTS